ncbi:MAG TPA: hypothetical protein VIT65_06555 [Microlunatus sp.]
MTIDDVQVSELLARMSDAAAAYILETSGVTSSCSTTRPTIR